MRENKKKWATAALVGLVVFLAACGNDADLDTEPEEETEIEEIVLGYFPSADVENMAESAEPLEAYLEEELGIPVQGEVVTNYAGLIEGLANDQVDVAFLPPFAYVQAEERAGAEVLLKAIRDDSESYVAQYVVRQDSDLESVEDLVETDGLNWAFGDFSSTSGYLFPAQQLLDLGVDDLDDHFSMIESGAHDSALLQVLDGDADFATTFEDARVRLEGDIPTIFDELRVIGTTDDIPNATLSVREGLPEDIKQQIKESFLAINENEEMLTVMEEVYNWEGFAEASPEDYDIVREVYAEFEELIEE